MDVFRCVWWCAIVLPGTAATAQLEFSEPVEVNSSGVIEEFAPAFAGDGHGTWIATWHTYGVTDIGNDSSIAYARSRDGGETWSETSLFDPAPASESANELGPTIATDGMGNWVTIWHSFEDLGIPGGNGPKLYVTRSDDDGRTWTDPEYLDPTSGSSARSDADAQLVTDGRGLWIAVWDALGDPAVGFDHDFLISRSTNNGADWSPPAILNTDAATDDRIDIDPAIVTDGNGLWVVCWTANEDVNTTNYDILYMRSTDNALTWSEPQLLDTNAPTDQLNDFSISLATDGLGTWIAVWSANGIVGSNSSLLYSRSVDDAQTWSGPQLVVAGPGDRGYEGMSSIATDGAGHWAIVWASQRSFGLDWDLLLAESDDDGITWSAPMYLDPARASDGDYEFERMMHLSTDRSGDWLAMWTEGDGYPLRGFITGAELKSSNSFLKVNSGGGGCFIATAAYGTPLAAELDRLRAVRDERFLHTATGAAFVDAYYRLSPPAAAWISEHAMARSVMWALLTPLTWSTPGGVGCLLAIGIGLGILAARKRRV